MKDIFGIVKSLDERSRKGEVCPSRKKVSIFFTNSIQQKSPKS